jgi:hypothetical protein
VELVELGAVVDDRHVAERLRAEAVLRVEVRDREDELAAACELLGRGPHASAVRRPHARVDDERLVVAEHHPDVRHERDAAVRDDVHALGDLARAAFDDRRGRCRFTQRVAHGA